MTFSFPDQSRSYNATRRAVRFARRMGEEWRPHTGGWIFPIETASVLSILSIYSAEKISRTFMPSTMQYRRGPLL